MSKCYPNWQRLPNSRRDRQNRPRQFLRQKNRVEDTERIEKKFQRKLEKAKHW